ncbi:MAG: glycosyltransferase [Planctomycetes bacterium]|nr:glycosyltransferase [Planctomycetota bacterium]
MKKYPPFLQPEHSIDSERDGTATFLFSGGGTGGHLFPGFAVAKELQHQFSQANIVFAGTGQGWEREIVAQQGYAYLSLRSKPFPKRITSTPGFLHENLHGWITARQWLKKHRVVAGIGLGGYSSAPAMYAMIHRGIPTVVLEQNLIPGKTTRWFANQVQCIFTAFEQTQSLLPQQSIIQYTGNPTRSESSVPNRTSAYLEKQLSLTTDSENLGDKLFSKLDPGRNILLVTGGIQGARGLNNTVLNTLKQAPELSEQWQIIHQTGHTDYQTVRRTYQSLPYTSWIAPFIPCIHELFPKCDLAVSRAGGTTLAELALAGLPALLIPYPHASQDHQLENAGFYHRNGAALVVSEKRADQQSTDNRCPLLFELLNNQEKRIVMGNKMRELARPKAAMEIVHKLLSLSGVAPDTITNQKLVLGTSPLTAY